jgi:hypothetical protein
MPSFYCLVSYRAEVSLRRSVELEALGLRIARSRLDGAAVCNIICCSDRSRYQMSLNTFKPNQRSKSMHLEGAAIPCNRIRASLSIHDDIEIT